ncbi:MAG: 6,7-dimethyl-8-ribityllumazine synthase [Bacteroidota bacterium]|nr:6,7-dimethyl-8-ribityllumazine synthase [Bacteroidota bacterium]
MATSLKNLSSYDPASIPTAEDKSFGIVVAEWNFEITNALLHGAIATLKKHGASLDDIIVKYVPGTFELTHGAKLFGEHTFVDAVIVLGCVIQGETRHFDFICKSVTEGITKLNLDYEMPFIFGVLTTDNQQQAIDRSGGKYGNKGIETALAAIKMVKLVEEMESGEDGF